MFKMVKCKECSNFNTVLNETYTDRFCEGCSRNGGEIDRCITDSELEIIVNKCHKAYIETFTQKEYDIEDFSVVALDSTKLDLSGIKHIIELDSNKAEINIELIKFPNSKPLYNVSIGIK